jgi:hypothetical protein
MRRAFLLTASLALAACHDGAAPPEQQGRPPVLPPLAATTAAPASASIAVRDAGGAEGPFRLGDLDRLDVEVRYANLEPGPHAVRVDVVAPGGLLYAQLQASLQADGDGAAASSHRVAVQGTPIETYRQVGRWRLAISVDGSPLASADVDLAE